MIFIKGALCAFFYERRLMTRGIAFIFYKAYNNNIVTNHLEQVPRMVVKFLSKNNLNALAEFTHYNDAGGALVYLADKLQQVEMKKELISICQAHNNLGYLSGELYEKRQEIYLKLINVAKALFTEEQVDQIYHCL